MINHVPALLIVADPATAESSSALENFFGTVALIAIAVFVFVRWAKARVQESDAIERARALSHVERDVIERQILDLVYKARNQSMRVREIAVDIGEHHGFVSYIVKQLVKWNQVEVLPVADGVPDPNFDHNSRVALTAEGDKRLREREPIVNNIHHGDYFYAGDNATVVNKSVVVNSHIGVYENKYDKETVAALRKLEEVVRASGDGDAIETLDGFLAEARSASPSRARMRALFSGIQQLVPALSGMVDLVTKVTSIFS